MWSGSYSLVIRDLTCADVFNVWSDVDHWPDWQDDVAYTQLHGAFQAGTFFTFQPKGGPKLRLELVKVEKNRSFTDLTRFPLARMYGIHEFLDHKDGIELRTTMQVSGPLAFVWRRLVAQNIVKDLPKQTARVVEFARNMKRRQPA